MRQRVCLNILVFLIMYSAHSVCGISAHGVCRLQTAANGRGFMFIAPPSNLRCSSRYYSNGSVAPGSGGVGVVVEGGEMLPPFLALPAGPVEELPPL